MKFNFKWRKGLFSNTYKIYSNDRLIGTLKDELFSQKAIGEFNGMRYLFKNRGFFKQTTEIIDLTKNEVFGKITYGKWRSKAIISVNDESSNWKYDNLWNTKWSIFDTKGTKIKYTGSSTSGKIESNSENILFLLSGLYVINYYWQLSVAVIVAVFVPIFAAILNQ
jgi:DNA-binding beta-propeller fold protein YncE